MKKSYVRKISSEEAEKQYILILKSKLKFFPDVGKKFQLTDGRQRRTAQVESYPCQCVGPEEPHEHYYITKSGLKKGNVVEILKDEKNKDNYILTLK